jgi:two-component system nitrogen regulation sensor histidine kinase NtrY
VLRKVGAAGLASALEEVEASSGVVRREFGLAAPGGAVTTLRAVASVVLGPRQRVMGKVIVFEDVTDLIRSKKLVAWNEMARQVAHEIKNPLTPMKLSAQQILQAHRDGAPDFDEILEESLATIVDEIEALRRIAVEFSQFSRMPERKIAATDINQVVEESLAQYERVACGDLSITKALDPGLPSLALDRDEIKRVFVNVIENAIQAMPAGGRLEVRSCLAGRRDPCPGAAGRTGLESGEAVRHRIRASSRPAYAEPLRDYVEVSFTDTGSGISVANSEKLFGPNFSTKTHGTGLGLVISKGAVDAHGGEIVIESTEGVGTCVRIRLPLGDLPASQRRRPRRRYSRGRHRPRQG